MFHQQAKSWNCWNSWRKFQQNHKLPDWQWKSVVKLPSRLLLERLAMGCLTLTGIARRCACQNSQLCRKKKLQTPSCALSEIMLVRGKFVGRCYNSSSYSLKQLQKNQTITITKPATSRKPTRFVCHSMIHWPPESYINTGQYPSTEQPVFILWCAI